MNTTVLFTKNSGIELIFGGENEFPTTKNFPRALLYR